MRLHSVGASGGKLLLGLCRRDVFWFDPNEDLLVISMTQLMGAAADDLWALLRTLVYSSLLK
jgi:hypothetical protein